MKKSIAVLLLPLLTGCLTTESTEVSYWLLGYRPKAAAVAAPKYQVARVSSVTVRAPYRTRSIVVFRAGGTVALDSYNEYAAEPMQMLRGVVVDALEGSGLFRSVVQATSLAKADVSVEIDVTSLALDCRDPDISSRKAMADLVVRLIDGSGAILKIAKGSGSAPAAEPDFGTALSFAFSQAIEQALHQLE